jgi:ankyrin repeat protein
MPQRVSSSNSSYKDLHAAFFQAIQLNQVSILDRILKNHPLIIRSTDEDGNNGLHYLSSLDNVRLNIARHLISYDSSLINAINNNGQTPLHRAVQENKFYLAKILLESNANPNAQDKQLQTPIHYLADKCPKFFEKFATIFKPYKANLAIVDNTNETISDKLKKKASNSIQLAIFTDMLNTLQNQKLDYTAHTQ